jgi:hypothetical protein
MGTPAFAAVNDFDDVEQTTPHREIPDYECPMCTGTGEFMGGMAHREWFRCRSCAIDYSRTVERKLP